MPAKTKPTAAQVEAPAEILPDQGQPRYPSLPVQYHVRIHSIKPDGTVKGFASVNLNGQFAVRGIKVLEGSNGLRIAMPSYRTGDKYQDVCFPCTAEARQDMQNAVIAAYQQAIEQMQTVQHENVAPAHQPTPEPALSM